MSLQTEKVRLGKLTRLSPGTWSGWPSQDLNISSVPEPAATSPLTAVCLPSAGGLGAGYSQGAFPRPLSGFSEKPSGVTTELTVTDTAQLLS